MARSRNIHTDISIEPKLNRVTDFAALLYSWMIPHAKDNCRLHKKDAEELRLLLCPGRAKTAADIAVALAELVRERLIGIDDDGSYFFPAEAFYKYQSYINVKNRSETPPIGAGAENSRDCQKTAEIAREGREEQVLPENSTSLSLTLSPSLSLSEAASAASSSARAKSNSHTEKVEDYLGLGERHPAKQVGWSLWVKIESFWRSRGKSLGVFQLELYGQKLIDFRHRGHDPTVIVETTLRQGWMDLYEPDKDPPEGGESTIYDFDELRRNAAERAKATRVH